MLKLKDLMKPEPKKDGANYIMEADFERMQCSENGLKMAKEDTVVIAPNAELKIKKIPNQTIKANKWSDAINLDSYVISSNCKLDEIEWSAASSQHLYVMTYISHDAKVKPDEGWCGQEKITFIADTPNGRTVRIPVIYTVKCPD